MTYKLIDYKRLKAFSEGLKSKYAIKNDLPTKLSDLQEDATHRLVTDSEKKNWNDKVSQSQITSDGSATGSDKVFSVDIINKGFETFDAEKINKAKITDNFNGSDSELVLSQRGAQNLYYRVVDDFNTSIEYFTDQKADKDKVPTKLSDLTNDTTFKTEAEIQSMIEKASSLKKEVVTSLPTTGKDDVIYLVQDPKGKDNNNYLEYLWLNGKYELIGSTQVDLSGYATKNDVEKYQQDVAQITNIVSEIAQKTSYMLTTDNVSITFPDQDSTKLATAGQLNAVYENTQAINQSVKDMGAWLEEELDKKLNTTDIQEFTQQELEEAFK